MKNYWMKQKDERTVTNYDPATDCYMIQVSRAAVLATEGKWTRPLQIQFVRRGDKLDLNVQVSDGPGIEFIQRIMEADGPCKAN